MKKILVGLLILGSFSTYAETLDFCVMKDGELSGNTLEIINKGYEKAKRGNSSRVVCHHHLSGNYLYINTTQYGGYFKINLESECIQIIKSMEANPRIAYEFQLEGDSVVRVTKSPIRGCDSVGDVSSTLTILDL